MNKDERLKTLENQVKYLLSRQVITETWAEDTFRILVQTIPMIPTVGEALNESMQGYVKSLNDLVDEYGGDEALPTLNVKMERVVLTSGEDAPELDS